MTLSMVALCKVSCTSTQSMYEASHLQGSLSGSELRERRCPIVQ
jgi:hypothetical protein